MIRCVSRAFYRVRTLDSPPLCSQGFGPFAKNGFREFHRAKMSYEDTQHKHIKQDFSSKNQIEWLKPYTCIVKL